MPISHARADDLPHLFEVWESAVRTTHDFLTEDAIAQLAPLVRTMLADFSPLYCLRDSNGAPYAFLGAADAAIEMLFVHRERRGTGAGRTLVEFAMTTLGARKVDVNEQNSQATGFYRRLGFVQVGRSAQDPFGNPYPILHLELP